MSECERCEELSKRLDKLRKSIESMDIKEGKSAIICCLYELEAIAQGTYWREIK